MTAEGLRPNSEVTPRKRYIAVKKTVSKPMTQKAIIAAPELCAVHRALEGSEKIKNGGTQAKINAPKYKNHDGLDRSDADSLCSWAAADSS